MKKLPISIALTAHNEARNIKRCLTSVKDWVSEIVVVINNCTDGTDDIARGYGANVFEEKWHGYRDQKNIALEKVTQKWVLCVDCDEEVSPELKGAIIDFVENDNSDYNGAFFPRKTWFIDRWITHGDWYPDLGLRLIRNGKGRWGGSQEHDKMELEGESKRLTGDLHHYSNPTLHNQLEKLVPFSDIFLKRQLKKKAKWSALNAIFRGGWRFFRCYFLRMGFLDGFPGFYIAVFQGFSTFYRYTMLYEHLYKKNYSRLA